MTVEILIARHDGKNLSIFAGENSITLPLKKEDFNRGAMCLFVSLSLIHI